MRYKDFETEDFLADEFFIQWVKNPNDNNRHFWEKWLAQHPEKRRVVMEAVSIISAIHYKGKFAVNDRLYIETFENIIKAEREGGHKAKNTFERRTWDFFVLFRQAAAGLLILFCLGLLYRVVFDPHAQEEVKEHEVVTLIKANPAGKKSLITLSDGSKIYLNSESEISYGSRFSDSIRRVSLKGEAFFEVAKESRPFVVETQGTQIRVLGTSFNVNQKENGSLTVALVSGKVRINDPQGNQVHLEPNEMMVKDQGGNLHKTNFDPLEITGWKDKILVFKKSAFSEVREKIEKWYGVEVRINGRINSNWSYSGIYRDETLENVLRGIFLTSGLSYDIENKTVTITNPR